MHRIAQQTRTLCGERERCSQGQHYKIYNVARAFCFISVFFSLCVTVLLCERSMYIRYLQLVKIISRGLD